MASEDTREAVGLCGPSELRVSRARLPAAAPSVLAAVASETPQPASERISALRCNIAQAVADRIALIGDCGGSHKIAELVAALLEARPKHHVFRSSDLHTQRAGRGGGEHMSSRSRIVDFLFKVTPKTSHSQVARSKLESLLKEAWEEDAELCVRLVFHLGAARRGKQDRWNFYDAAEWLWRTSPATVLKNLHRVEPTIYWKALLEILARICEGPQLSLERDIVMYQSYVHGRPRLLAEDATAPPVDADAPGWRYTFCRTEEEYYCGKRVACGEAVEIPEGEGWTTSRVGNGQDSSRRKAGNCGWRPRTRLEQAEHAVRRFDRDAHYRALHLRVAALFAEQLAKDEVLMREGKTVKSLAAKWAPLLDKSFDRRTLVAESIARMLYPPHLQEFEGLTEQHYSYRARLKYAKLLSSLKEHRKEVARLVNAGRWAEIKYSAVPGTALRLLTPKFLREDAERFQAFRDAAKKGAVKARAGGLQPHQLLRTAVAGKPAAVDVAEAQWRTLVAGVRQRCKEGEGRILAVCDLSESMMQEAAMDIPHRAKAGASRFDDPPDLKGPVTCMDIGLALSLVISEIAEERFSNSLMVFHDKAKVVRFEAAPSCTTIARRLQHVKAEREKAILARELLVRSQLSPALRQRLGLTTNFVKAIRERENLSWSWLPEHIRRQLRLSSHFFKVFETLLKSPEIPDRLFVFSAMAFNRAIDTDGRDPGEYRRADGERMTVFEAAQELFRKAGKTLPEIVFWNLAGCEKGSPVVATQPGVTIVSGFSASLIKDLLDGGLSDPLSLVEKIVSAPLFEAIGAVHTAEEAERVLQEALVLEGRAAQLQSESTPHRFPAGEEWEMVQEHAPVELEEVERAAPRRPPLLAARSVRRVCAEHPDVAEEALLALIGWRGQSVRHARKVLSVVAASCLGRHARVWLDAEYVGDRLGVLAVTLSARTPLVDLEKLLHDMLLPAVDCLLARCRRDPAEVETRRRVWEEQLLARAAGQAGPLDKEWRARKTRFSGYESEEDADLHALWAPSGPRELERPPERFLPLEDVVPALLGGLEGEAREAFGRWAPEAERRLDGEWPPPRTCYNPPPRAEAPSRRRTVVIRRLGRGRPTWAHYLETGQWPATARQRRHENDGERHLGAKERRVERALVAQRKAEVRASRKGARSHSPRPWDGGGHPALKGAKAKARARSALAEQARAEQRDRAHRLRQEGRARARDAKLLSVS